MEPLHPRTVFVFVILVLVGIDGTKGTVLTSKGWQLIDSLHDYYIVKPIQSNPSILESEYKGSIQTLVDEEHGLHMPEITVSFDLGDSRFDLVLTLNDELIPASFTTSRYDENDKYIIEKHSAKMINNCYYHGYVDGRNSSTVVVSTCNGIEGAIFTPDRILEIAPIDEMNMMHIVYESPHTYNHSCGTNHVKLFHEVMSLDSPHVRLRRDALASEKKFVELMFVSDQKDFKQHGTREKLYEFVKKIVNYMDGLYKKLDLRVVLLHVEVWENGDKIESDDDAQNVLNHFLAYRKDRLRNSAGSSPWRYTDNVQLLYGSSFAGTTVGMATVSSMCGLRSGGVNEDRGNAIHTAATVAHEMGHNLGMSHDSKDCTCDGTKCVMAATASATAPDAWTDCSVNYLKQGYKYGTANCLLNVPDSSRLFGGPECGNGIVEKGEKCDCGYPDECISKCCNATTCQLHPDADCAEGTCCTDCHFKPSCSICRPEENDCDIAEYCNGRSAHCPGNIHKIDGMDCRDKEGVCYGGVCRTHEMQCQEIWGDSAINGEEQCYLSVNKKGDQNGNCGKANDSYIPCEPENAVCGKLMCIGGEKFPLVGADRVSFRNTFRNFECKSLSSDGSSDVGDVGLVWDGTKCGEGKMCFGGSCEVVENIVRQCSEDCHGHGICNNFGNCHCDAGWAPPDCSRKGNGGSGDSGPICVSTIDTQVVLLLVFFLVILPAILAIITYIWWRYCGGKPKMYAWRKNRQRRKLQQGKANMAPAPQMGGSHEDLVSTSPPAHPSPTRPPPPSRPSPMLPVRAAPTRPPTSVPTRQPPARPAPAPKPPLKTQDVRLHAVNNDTREPMTAKPARPAPAPKPAMKVQDVQPQVANDYTDEPKVQPSSIHERIKQLQRNNVV